MYNTLDTPEKIRAIANSLIYLSEIEKGEPSKSVSASLFDGNEFSIESISHFEKIVCQNSGIDNPELLKTTCRETRLKEGRWIMFAYLKFACGWTLKNIGAKYGNRDHATVIHGLNELVNEFSIKARRRKYISLMNGSHMEGFMTKILDFEVEDLRMKEADRIRKIKIRAMEMRAEKLKRVKK